MAGFESFSIALERAPICLDAAQLAIFIRGVDKEFTVTEELLALQPLKGTTTGEDILMKLKSISLQNVMNVVVKLSILFDPEGLTIVTSRRSDDISAENAETVL
ncbi:General transcription factor II-I repeat domain-containing protein 2B [Eumeta japonica]|uniref:General transcription factor II-I repeat domain-containing protein 2B n=1 Tax=Eumeta variegata TaxID=151549 RepID=A0A4C2A7I5_EUMVA|nr:General transcription factor II-I repeat domain-containing protein 2B [Eumeta japonica]